MLPEREISDFSAARDEIARNPNSANEKLA